MFVTIFHRTHLGYYSAGMHIIFILENSANYRDLAKLCPFHALIVRRENVSPYWLCMTTLSEFRIVFYSSALIPRNKDAFEGHLLSSDSLQTCSHNILPVGLMSKLTSDLDHSIHPLLKLSPL